MTEIRNYDTAHLVAIAAAENAVEVLNTAINENGKASWVLAGGSSPVAAYKYIVSHFADAVDWSKVTILMGDERFVPLDHTDSNWGHITEFFEAQGAFLALTKLTPEISETAEETARRYEAKITQHHIERFDLVWIGVGEDGHTLSLFPDNPAFTHSTDAWVVPVYDSPKPPAQRFTLSLKALEHVVELVIFATGAGKKEVLRVARLRGGLPIAVAAEVAEMNGADVRWLYDDAAWGEK